MNLLKQTLAGIFLINTLSTQAFAQLAAPSRGADGIEIQPVPIDTRVNCSSVILRGTRNNQGTVFVLPRVMISIDRKREQLFEVVHLGDGKYQLVFSLYFPRIDSELESRKAFSKLNIPGCNIDEVVTSLNKTIKDEEQKVTRVARVPIKYIQVSVSGIEGIDGSYMIGSKQTTMLNYQGTDLMVTMPIKDRATVDRVLARLRQGYGLEVRADMAFNARTGDGGVYASIKTDKLVRGLDTAFKGAIWVAEADLRATISSNISQMDLNLETYEGTGSAVKDITEKIMQMIMAKVQATPKPTETPVAKSETPTTPPGKSGSSDKDKSDKEKTVVMNDSGKNGETTPAPKPTPAPAPKPTPAPSIGDSAPSNGLYNVKAVLTYLKDQSEINIAYSNFSANREEIYSTSVIVQADLDDPEMRTLKVRANESSLYSSPVKKDEELFIVPMGKRVETFSYDVPTKSYFTTTEIKQRALPTLFPDLQLPFITLEDAEIASYGIAAHAFTPSFFGGVQPHIRDPHWGMIQFNQQVASTVEVDIPWDEEAFTALPLKVQFSKVGGQKYNLKQILAGNIYWDANYDSVGGKIRISAKRDLGRATFYWNEAPVMEEKLLQYYFQEERTAMRGMQAVSKAAVRKMVPVESTTFLMRVLSSAEAVEGIPKINVRSASSPDGSPAMVEQD